MHSKKHKKIRNGKNMTIKNYLSKVVNYLIKEHDIKIVTNASHIEKIMAIAKHLSLSIDSSINIKTWFSLTYKDRLCPAIDKYYLDDVNKPNRPTPTFRKERITKKDTLYEQADKLHKSERKEFIANAFRRENIKKATKAEKRILSLLVETREKYSHFKFEFQKLHIEDEAFFISDFFLPLSNITLEIDGGYHFTKEQQLKDGNKSVYLLNQGIKTIRLTNDQALSFSFDSFLVFLLKNSILIKK